MPRHARLNALLHNTLGTFASQYTRWQGYVLFGFLDPDAPPLTFDLLNPPTPEPHVLNYAHRRAAAAFHDQARKQQVAGVATAASLTLAFGPDPVEFEGCTGRVLTLAARAESVYATYTCTRLVNVWRHDPAYEGYSDHA